jgi:hypothetical protein
VSAWITATTFESSKRKNHYEKGIIIHHPGSFVHVVHVAACGQTTVISRSHYHLLGQVKIFFERAGVAFPTPTEYLSMPSGKPGGFVFRHFGWVYAPIQANSLQM